MIAYCTHCSLFSVSQTTGFLCYLPFTELVTLGFDSLRLFIVTFGAVSFLITVFGAICICAFPLCKLVSEIAILKNSLIVCTLA